MQNFKFRGYDLPCQSQPPGFDSIIGIIVSQGAKFDILRCLVF